VDTQIIEMLRYARVPFELNAKPGDRVLLVTDTRVDPVIWQALAAASYSTGCEVTTVVMIPRQASGHEPPPEVAAAMMACDICVTATSRSLAHTKARLEAGKAGVAQIFMDNLTPGILKRGATVEQYRAMQELGNRIAEKWRRGTDLHISSPAGTDLTASVAGRNGFPLAAMLLESPFIDGRRCAFPDGECGVAPVEGTANGVVVWDVSVDGLGGLEQPIRLSVEKSYITKIDGGRQAKEFDDLLRTHGDEQSFYFPAEVSIGLNPAYGFTGDVRTDKKARGGLHIAVGTNADIGGTIRSVTHIDGMCRGCTLRIDGEVIVKDGEIVV
jgi:2,5-dihydroxypyridine 5,6-dioxygenase